jgi:type I restriction enzyme M protein
MVNLIQPKFEEKIYDPFCGTGGFLTEAFRYIKTTNSIKEKSKDDKKLKNGSIFGCEITTTARIAKMNMILFGDGHSGVDRKDSLKNPVNQKYDIVLTNPPFSQVITYKDLRGKTQNDITKLYENGLAKNSGDGVCLLHCFKSIKKGGRMAIIVSEGVLFRKELSAVRQYITEHSNLHSIISLPSGCFYPYTGVKTDILYLTDIESSDTKYYWYFKVNNDGFSLDSRRRKIDGENDFDKINSSSLGNILLDKDEIEYLSNIGIKKINIQDIKENNYFFLYRKFQEQNIKNSLLSLNDISIEIKNGTLVKQKEVGKYYVSRIESISNGFFNIERTKKTDEIPKFESDFLKNGDILFSHINSMPHLAKTAIFENIQEKVIHGINLLKIRPNINKIIPKYLLYVLKSEKIINEIKKYAKEAVNQASIACSDIKKIKIPIPLIEIQNQIVGEIENYQKIIIGARQTIDNWKPQILFDSAWKLANLNEYCTFMTGGTPTSTIKKYYKNGQIPWLVSGDIHKEKIYNCDGRITDLGLKNSNTKYLPQNSVLIALNGQGKTRGTVAMLYIKNSTCNQSLVSIMPKDNNVLLSEFLYYQLKTMYQQIRDITGDGQRSGLNISLIKQIQIYLPPIEKQKEIVSKIEKEEKLVGSNKKLIEIMDQKIKDRIDDLW